MAIIVVNHSESELVDRFNGIDLVFPLGKKVLLDEDAARHVFGFGEEDKAPYLARLGWIRSNGDYTEAMKRLAKFTFSMFDPYAQLDEAAPGGHTAQQLSPVAPGDSGEAVSDGPAEVVSPTLAHQNPARTSNGIFNRLKNAVA